MADDPEKKKAAAAKPKGGDLFSQLPAPELRRVAALPDGRACVVYWSATGRALHRNDGEALAVRRMGDKLRALRGKAEAELLRKLLGKNKPKGAADVDVSAVKKLLN